MADINHKLIEDRWQTLSNELKVGVKIQELNRTGKIAYFSLIVNELKKDMSRGTVHTSLDNLVDLGTISAEWTKTKKNWVRRYYIAGESEGFINRIIDEIYSK